jgi:uncharacterized membrane protein
MEHHVTIAVGAPPEAVWGLFADVERWPEMTESISDVRRVDSGPLRVGSEAIVRQPRLPQARWRVTEIEPGHSFLWQTSFPGVTSVGGHTVDADGQGSVVTLTLRVHGPLARPVYALTRARSRRYLAMEAEGFKRTAEARGPGS